MSKEALKDAVKVAAKRTVSEILANHPGESLNAYALMTDDDLRTLGHIASTVEASLSEPSARFEPVDWTYDDGAAAFDEPRRFLVASADSTTSETFVTHVNESFAALVEALRELKSEGIFQDAVFLTVISTDPNEHLERLEDGAVRALNSLETYQQWKTSLRGT